MKKSLLFAFWIILLGAFGLQAQSTTTTYTCGTTFTDPGGEFANYPNNANVMYYICPNNTNEYVTVAFTSFNLENNFDFLRLYVDGVLAATYTGTAIPPNFTTQNPGQCIQYQFTSDNSVNQLGWTASVTCGTSPPVVTVGCYPPSSVAVTGTSSSQNGISATLTLNGTDNNSQWEVIAQLASAPSPTANSQGVTYTSNPLVVPGLVNNNVYIFYVRSNCGTNGNSVWIHSNTLTLGTPGATTCSPPTGVTAAATVTQSAGTITATATMPSQGQGMQFLLLTQTAPFPTTATSGIPVTGSTYTFQNVAFGNYIVYVRADCGNGVLSAWVPSSTVTVGSIPNPQCGGFFYDNGGPNGNYSNNADVTTTICPSNPGDVMTVTFQSFNTESNWDALYVYNGNSITAPQIASSNPAGNVPGGVAGGFWGTAIPGPFTSTATNGCLTFRFRSDGSVTLPGWVAEIVCAPPPSCPAPSALTVSNIGFTNATIGWNSNSNAMEWEVLVLPPGTAPGPNDTGTSITNNPHVLTNLSPNTTYSAYIRNICGTGDNSVWRAVTFTTLGCPNPTQTGVTQITQNSAFILTNSSGTTGSTTEVIISPMGTPAPSPSEIGALATPNGYQANGLTCGTSFQVYVRVSCNNGTIVNAWTLTGAFTTLQCTLSTGQPNNMFQCGTTATACFTLTDNDAPILGNLNPAEYSVQYYATTADAAAQTNALLSPYCVQYGTYTIIARLTQLSSGQAQFFTFSISYQSTNPEVVLTPLSSCDDNSDGQVVFTLNNLVATNNTLAYYDSFSNAKVQVNPIANPEAYAVPVTIATRTIFIRETTTSGCDNLYSVTLHVNSNCNVSSTCINAFSLCGTLGTPFNNTYSGSQAEPGNNYGCLLTRPNPSWFYLPVSTNGTLNLTIQQNTAINMTGVNLDVDYIIYGPFTNPVSPCTTPLMSNQIVACSYSSAAIEYPVIQNAVAGQYYLIMTTNFSNQPGFIKITMNNNSTGAIDCLGIKMNAFLDSNNNSVQDANESNFPLGQFHYTLNNGTMHNITSPTGMYTIYDSNVNNVYQLSYTINANYTAQYAVTTASYSNVTVTITGGVTTYNFPVTALQNYHDVAVFILPQNAPRAGSTYKNKIVYTNLGSQTIPSGMLTFTKDPVTTITTVTQAGTVPNSTGFDYTYTNLLPFETRTMTVTMSVPPIPTVALNQLLTNTAMIGPTANDVVVNNNTSTSTQAIIAAYDPNDKTEAHGEKIVYSSFAADEYLYYMIRFENLGNASAIDVRIVDELHAQLNETTLEMVAASHAYTLDRVGRTLTWQFDNIQLPVSVANTDTGKGYVTFRIRLNPGYGVGTIIPNTASIYFDFNPPIITNTFQTEFVAQLSNSTFDAVSVMVYPNPARELVTLQSVSTVMMTRVTLFDLLGKKVQQQELPGVTTATIGLGHLPRGVYILMMQLDNGTSVNKKLIIE